MTPLPLNEQAFEYLKKMITDNTLQPDTIYSETKLSKELGISRTPFRDAIHRLAQEGYIDIIPSKGFCLHKLSVQDVWDTFQLRSALECYCAVEISKAADTPRAGRLFDELSHILERSRQILDDPSRIDEFLKYDLLFHTMIIDFFENRELSSTFSAYLYRIKSLADLTLHHAGRIEDAFTEHFQIFQSMKEGDACQSYEQMRAHMEKTKQMSLEALENN